MWGLIFFSEVRTWGCRFCGVGFGVRVRVRSRVCVISVSAKIPTPVSGQG